MARKGKLGKNSRSDGQEQNNNAKRAADEKRDGISGKKNYEPGASEKDSKRESNVAKKGAGQIVANLGGLIFMCNGTTKRDCYKYRVFGLNEGRKKLVEQVRKGMRLFLFDVDLRLLYGVYTASSSGTYKLEPDAFRGQFPWQVRFSIQKDCLPLSEDMFKAAIKESYVDERRFKVELTIDQVHRLVKLFRPIPGVPGRSPFLSRASVQDHQDVTESDTHWHSHRPPRAIYEPAYDPVNRNMPEKQPYGQYGPKYADLHGLDEAFVNDGISSGVSRVDRKSAYNADDRYMGREIRAQRGIDRGLSDAAILSGVSRVDHKSIYSADDPYRGLEFTAQRGIDSVISEHNLSSLSLPPYSNDLRRPLSNLQLAKGREDLSSAYSYGRTHGSPVSEVGWLYDHTLPPDARENMLSRRLAAFDPLVERLLPDVGRNVSDRRLASLDPLADRLLPDAGRNVSDKRLGAIDPLVASYMGGLSSEVVHGRAALHDPHGMDRIGFSRVDENASLLEGGISSASGLHYRDKLLPRSSYYGL